VCGLCRWPSSFHTMWWEEPLVLLLPLLPRSNHAASSSLGPSPSSSPPPPLARLQHLLLPRRRGRGSYSSWGERGPVLVYEGVKRRSERGGQRVRCWREMVHDDDLVVGFLLVLLVMWVKKPSSDRCTWSPSSLLLVPSSSSRTCAASSSFAAMATWGIKQLGPNRRPCVLSRVIYLCKTEMIATADC
jgi:hypothetical protein